MFHLFRAAYCLFEVGLVTLAMCSVVVGCRREFSDDELARGRMDMPAGAHVVRVVDGDWGGDYEIYFTLPVDRPVTNWLEDVWDRNLSRTHGLPKGRTRRDEYEIYVEAGFAERSVKYISNEGLYVYRVRLEK